MKPKFENGIFFLSAGRERRGVDTPFLLFCVGSVFFDRSPYSSNLKSSSKTKKKTGLWWAISEIHRTVNDTCVTHSGFTSCETKKTLNRKKPSEALAKRKSFQFSKDSWLHPAAQSDNVFKATEEIHLPLLPKILRGN